MRADRLISLLMLLKSRGRMTAAQLAKELEVSERTIYRDIDALSASGMPVYADRGAEGGFNLDNDYRLELGGLTESEVRAVFLLSIPTEMADLGLDKALASALRKLSASISERRGQEVRFRERVYLDPGRWVERRAVYPVIAPHLNALRHAAWYDRRARISYRLPSGPTAKQWIHVYGLVSREGRWYVVYVPENRAREGPWTSDEVQALPLADLQDVQVINESFSRRQDFDLIRTWGQWCARQKPPRFKMTLLVSPEFVPRLAVYGIDDATCQETLPDEEGRVTVTATCQSFEDARAKVLGLGRAVEVVEPEALRCSVVDYAEQILARHRP